MTDPLRLFAVDIGNTKVAVAYLVGGNVERLRSFGHHEMAQVMDHLRRDPHLAVVVSSVHPQQTEELRQAMGDRPLRVAPADLSPPIENACSPPSSVGMDRLFDASAIENPPAVVVDAGTAITVDWIDPKGRFRGGAIAPGVGLGFRALHERTGKLPDLPPEQWRDAPPLGTNTEDAMRCGVLRGTAGLVDRLVEEVAQGVPAPVYLTGGDATRLIPYLRTPVIHEPHLMMKGIARAFAFAVAQEERR